MFVTTDTVGGGEETMTSVCAICLDEMGEGDPPSSLHVLERCGHRFHSNCLIGWLKQGTVTCPSCRSDASVLGDCIPGSALMARAAYMRRTVARRRSAPPQLLRQLLTLRRAEEKERTTTAALREFRRAQKEVLHELGRLRTSQYTRRMRVRNLTRLLGLFQCEGETLPALTVTP